MSALITGGAGFIGGSLVERLVSLGYEVMILDNLSSGSKENLSRSLQNSNVKFILGDCTSASDIQKALKNVEVIFHLAANPEVRLELANPKTCFRQNIYATHKLLEGIRRSKAHTIVFASSSTVYGDAEVIPTPEDYPTRPISIYGASKLASEALITAYAHTYNIKAIIFRLANIIGPKSHHGVIYDFIDKLKHNPEKLEILGDGRQEKSYLHIDDCIKAFISVTQPSETKSVKIFNVGTDDKVDVKTIAQIVVEEMKLNGVELHFTGGIDGRGWKGDVRVMLLNVSKLKSLAWQPQYNSQEAVRLTVRSLLKEAWTVKS